MKIIKLLRWKRVGLSSTILFVFILALLNTFNSFADDYFPESQPSFNIQQQKRQIAGIVTDAKGEAVIGANIIEKGTTNGTVTDNNG
ncbi:MAG TPA: hypothetical protein DCF46_05125, partial [Porphyromonadaceae bacterium]|nr:hypothetical protein [Porphyromonadaceae bacterium]